MLPRRHEDTKKGIQDILLTEWANNHEKNTILAWCDNTFLDSSCFYFFSAARSRCRHAVGLRFSEALHNARSSYADARAVWSIWIANVL
jgi:hypothetical protein